MLGSTAYVSWPACALMLGVLLVSWVVSVAASPLLDGLALGEFTALSLGLPVKSLRWVLLGVLAFAQQLPWLKQGSLLLWAWQRRIW